MLPGPTSSQVGFLIGARRAGWPGAIAAWLGFTAPSALVMYEAYAHTAGMQGPLAQAVLHGLKLAAVAIVAQAVWVMARTLCPDWKRAAIATGAGGLALAPGGAVPQLAIILCGALAGLVLCRGFAVPTAPTSGEDARLPGAWVGLAALGALLIVISAAPSGSLLALSGLFFRAGSLVFGGGHVVLPLLHDTLVSRHGVPEDTFLAGYGFAQALPGPLFTVAAFLGAASAPPHAAPLWALAALLAIFLPGLLLAAAGDTLWVAVSRAKAAGAALAGVNAAVVGILAEALYDPVGTHAVRSGTDAVVSLVCLGLLIRLKTPPLLVVLLCVIAATIAQRLAHS
jgi:chromate transporter